MPSSTSHPSASADRSSNDAGGVGRIPGFTGINAEDGVRSPRVLPVEDVASEDAMRPFVGRSGCVVDVRAGSNEKRGSARTVRRFACCVVAKRVLHSSPPRRSAFPSRYSFLPRSLRRWPWRASFFCVNQPSSALRSKNKRRQWLNRWRSGVDRALSAAEALLTSRVGRRRRLRPSSELTSARSAFRHPLEDLRRRMVSTGRQPHRMPVAAMRVRSR